MSEDMKYASSNQGRGDNNKQQPLKGSDMKNKQMSDRDRQQKGQPAGRQNLSNFEDRNK